jgi:hypothetical protein
LRVPHPLHLRCRCAYSGHLLLGAATSSRTAHTVGAPYATQLGISGVEISTALAAQRSGSARAASSGPTTLPQPRQALDKLAPTSSGFDSKSGAPKNTTRTYLSKKTRTPRTPPSSPSARSARWGLLSTLRSTSTTSKTRALALLSRAGHALVAATGATTTTTAARQLPRGRSRSRGEWEHLLCFVVVVFSGLRRGRGRFLCQLPLRFYVYWLDAGELIGWLVLSTSSPFPPGSTRTRSARHARPLPASYMNTQEDRDEET